MEQVPKDPRSGLAVLVFIPFNYFYKKQVCMGVVYVRQKYKKGQFEIVPGGTTSSW